MEFCLFGWRLDFRSGFKLGKKIFIIFLFFRHVFRGSSDMKMIFRVLISAYF